jgi:hypothetical protein
MSPGTRTKTGTRMSLNSVCVNEAGYEYCIGSGAP